MWILIASFNLSAFIKNSLFCSVTLSLYRKRPLSAFISLYQKWPLSRIFPFIVLSKTAFIMGFCFITLSNCPLLAFIENCLYRGFFALSKIAFIKEFLLDNFIENSLHQGFFASLLYKKGLLLPLSAFIKKSIFCFITLSKTACNGLYYK